MIEYDRLRVGLWQRGVKGRRMKLGRERTVRALKCLTSTTTQLIKRDSMSPHLKWSFNLLLSRFAVVS
jgi:hypothetical protein